MGARRSAADRMSRRRRVLFLQPSLQPPGGGNAVAVCALEALAEEFDVTVAALRDIDFDEIRRDYAIDLTRSPFRVIGPPRVLTRAIRRARMRGALLERYLLLRFARRVAAGFDVVVSFNNEIDVGDVPTVQYIHYPWGLWPRPDADLRPIHRIPGLLRAYYAVGRALAPVSAAQVARNVTLVNSDWTGGEFRRCYGADTITVYPPLMTGSPFDPAQPRSDAILVLGTFAPHKRIELAIEIVERIRARGSMLPLWVAGSRDPYHAAYGRRIERLIAKRPWIELHEHPSRAEVDALLQRARFGLHTMAEEHFGMAVAEMAASGCVPIVPRGGGQVEIVEGNEELLYDTPMGAAETIIRLLGDPQRLQTIAGALSASASRRFDRRRFQAQVTSIVARVAERAG